MGKRRQGARQDVLLLTELGDIVGLEFETEPGYIVSQDTCEAWHQDYNQQVINRKTGFGVQIITERHKDPVLIFPNRPKLQGPVTDVIYSQSQDAYLTLLNNRREKNKMLLWVAIIAIILTVVLSTAVLIRLKSSNHAVPSAITMLMASIFTPIIKREYKRDIDDKSELLEIRSIKPNIIQCIVIIEDTAELKFPRINTSLIPDDSIQRIYRGKSCHLLRLSKDGELFAIEPINIIKEGDSPKDLFIATNIERPVKAVFSFGENIIEKMKIGLFFLLCIVEIIILFLIITTSTGSTVS